MSAAEEALGPLAEDIQRSPAARLLTWARDGLRNLMGTTRMEPQTEPPQPGTFRDAIRPGLERMKWPRRDATSGDTEEGPAEGFADTDLPPELEAKDAPAPTAEITAAVSKAIQDAITNAKYKPKGSFTLSTIKNDPLANRLLDFVSGPESNGNYNAVWGKAGNKEDLSQFTVGDILARQAATIRRGGQSATGRYQFIRRTLAGLVEEMGIAPSTKFTPELQDQMALHLLKRRGLDKYRSGAISLEQFGNNLALEWASLPNLTTYRTKDGKLRREGSSAYAGDGLNASHVSTAAVRSVLLGGGDDEPAPAKRGRKKTS